MADNLVIFGTTYNNVAGFKATDTNNVVQTFVKGGSPTPTPADGKTRVYIHLEEERKSPMLGICPNGTVDVDWGDGSAHDTLTGTSTGSSSVKWTPTHNYAHGGDYVIVLSITGSAAMYGSSTSNEYCGLLRYSSGADTRNRHYINAIKKVEIGDNVTTIHPNAFSYCNSMNSITISDSVTSILNNTFYYCYSLANVTFPDNAISIGSSSFYGCNSLESFTIPDGATSISMNAFYDCSSLASMTIPDSVTSIGQVAFYNCYGIKEYHMLRTTPPTLSNTNAFSNIAADCIIYVPYSADHSILNAYKTASNWSTYASYMQEEPT